MSPCSLCSCQSNPAYQYQSLPDLGPPSHDLWTPTALPAPRSVHWGGEGEVIIGHLIILTTCLPEEQEEEGSSGCGAGVGSLALREAERV